MVQFGAHQRLHELGIQARQVVLPGTGKACPASAARTPCRATPGSGRDGYSNTNPKQNPPDRLIPSVGQFRICQRVPSRLPFACVAGKGVSPEESISPCIRAALGGAGSMSEWRVIRSELPNTNSRLRVKSRLIAFRKGASIQDGGVNPE